MFFNMKRFRYITIIFFVSILIILFRVYREVNVADDTTTDTARLKHIIDGDTIVVDYNGRDEKVRLIGINTPEIHHPEKGVEPYGFEAKRFVEELVRPGDTVKLEFDIQLRDKYGRLLAYVYLYDGRFLNALLVENGYAQVMTVPPNVKYQELFIKLQRDARENKRGMWNPVAIHESPGEKRHPSPMPRECNFVASKVGSVFHKPDCEWAKKISEWNRQCFNTREDAIMAGKRACRVCRP